MKPVSIPCIIVAGLCITACGGGENGGGAGPTDDSFTSFANSSADSFQAKMVDGGVTGRIAVQNNTSGGTSSAPFKVEISPDFQTATVHVGGAVYTLPADGPVGAAGGTYGDGGRSVTLTPANANTFQDTISFRNFTDGEFGIAAAGAETQPANLPTALVSYEGGWGFSTFNGAGNETGISGGTWDADVDFAAASDQVDLRLNTTEPTQVGTMTTSLDGNGFTGTIAFDDGTSTGSITVGGTFFGTTGQQLAGTLNGTLSDGMDTVDGIGIFFGSQ